MQSPSIVHVSPPSLEGGSLLIPPTMSLLDAESC
jgi:hypothetical protein